MTALIFLLILSGIVFPNPTKEFLRIIISIMGKILYPFTKGVVKILGAILKKIVQIIADILNWLLQKIGMFFDNLRF